MKQFLKMSSVLAVIFLRVSDGSYAGERIPIPPREIVKFDFYIPDSGDAAQSLTEFISICYLLAKTSPDFKSIHFKGDKPNLLRIYGCVRIDIETQANLGMLLRDKIYPPIPEDAREVNLFTPAHNFTVNDCEKITDPPRKSPLPINPDSSRG